MMWNAATDIPEWVQTVIFPVNQWLHVVCTALLVGGTLFYEFVLPRAIEDLREEVQLSVLGRVRWVFRRVVILSVVLLSVTGSVSLWRLYPQMSASPGFVVPPWIYAHAGLGALAMAVALRVMNRTRAPRHPLTWMRVNFVVMLIALFLAAVARHLRVAIQEGIDHDNRPPYTAPANR